MFKFGIEQSNISYADILQNQLLNAHFLYVRIEFIGSYGMIYIGRNCYGIYDCNG